MRRRSNTAIWFKKKEKSHKNAPRIFKSKSRFNLRTHAREYYRNDKLFMRTRSYAALASSRKTLFVSLVTSQFGILACRKVPWFLLFRLVSLVSPRTGDTRKTPETKSMKKWSRSIRHFVSSNARLSASSPSWHIAYYARSCLTIRSSGRFMSRSRKGTA